MINDIVHYLQIVRDFIRDPGDLIRWGGYPGLFLIIFLETGAMVFFLPGDSLLVTAGLYAAKGDLNILYLNLLLIPAAIAGDAVSYFMGRKSGPMLFRRPKSVLFRPEHLRAASAYYEKHGGKTIIIARFMPIFRTFVPIAAGMAEMGYRRFASFNVIGGILWIVSMTFIGYFLGTLVPNIDKHIEKVIIVVVFLSILPGLIGIVRSRIQAKKEADAGN